MKQKTPHMAARLSARSDFSDCASSPSSGEEDSSCFLLCTRTDGGEGEGGMIPWPSLSPSSLSPSSCVVSTEERLEVKEAVVAEVLEVEEVVEEAVE